MDGHSENRSKIATLLNELAVDEGIHLMPVDGVLVARHTEPRPRTPAIYEPMIVFIGQGRKQTYLGDEVYVYDPLHYSGLEAHSHRVCTAAQRREHGETRGDERRSLPSQLQAGDGQLAAPVPQANTA